MDSPWLQFYPSPTLTIPGPIFPADKPPPSAISQGSVFDFMDSPVVERRSFPSDLLSPSSPRPARSPTHSSQRSPHPYPRPDSNSTPPSSSTAPGPVRTKPKHTKHRLRDIDRKRICLYADAHPNKRQEEIGLIFKVERSTVSKILRDRAKWLKIPDEDDVNNKHLPTKTGKFKDLEFALMEHMETWHRQGKIMTDTLITETAKKLARTTFTADNFLCSAGWLDNFKKRQQIVNGVWTRAWPVKMRHLDAKYSPPPTMYIPSLPSEDEPSASTPAQPSQPSFALDPALANADGVPHTYTSIDTSYSAHDHVRSVVSPDQGHNSSHYHVERSVEHSPDPYTHQHHHEPHQPYYQSSHHHQHGYVPGSSQYGAAPLVQGAYTEGVQHAGVHADTTVADVYSEDVCPSYPHKHACQPPNNPFVEPTKEDAEEAITTVIAFFDKNREGLITVRERKTLDIIKQAVFTYGR